MIDSLWRKNFQQRMSSQGGKPSPNDILITLQEGNARFVSGTPQHPNRTPERLALAGREDQRHHAYATVVSCSDSRVPVELIFDAGVMDIFVVRVAGNVCGSGAVGSIEYGLAYVHTPVLVVLGHTQCGAVKTGTKVVREEIQILERNIVPLVERIIPAVKRALQKYQDVQGDAIIPFAVEENVWQSIEHLFRQSPVTRELASAGHVKVVGAIYDVATGRVNWLDSARVDGILQDVEASADKEIEPEAEIVLKL